MYRCFGYNEYCEKFDFKATLPELYTMFKSGRFRLSVVFFDGLSDKISHKLECL